MYKYFVSYVYKSSDLKLTGTGNNVISSPHPINDEPRLREVERMLVDKYPEFGNVVLTNFKELT